MTIEGYPQKTQESIEQFRDMVRSCAKEKMVSVKLWVIIPYTEEGIKALWENAQEVTSENENGNIDVGIILSCNCFNPFQRNEILCT